MRTKLPEDTSERAHESCTRVWTSPTSSTRLTFGLNMVIQSEPSFLRSFGAVSGSKLEDAAAATSVGSFSSLTVAVAGVGPGVGVLATLAAVAAATGGTVERGEVATSEPVTTEAGKAVAEPEPTSGRGAGW
jgi:hypothetical protein